MLKKQFLDKVIALPSLLNLVRFPARLADTCVSRIKKKQQWIAQKNMGIRLNELILENVGTVQDHQHQAYFLSE